MWGCLSNIYIFLIYLTLIRLELHSVQLAQVTIDTDNRSQDLLVSRSTNITESECVENRLEALELGRRCSRRCRKDMPCENTRKQCLCDSLCGLSCIKPDSTCHPLPMVENGDFNPKSNKFGAVVTFSCNENYFLFGSRERMCQGDEEWSGTPAECLKERQYSLES